MYNYENIPQGESQYKEYDLTNDNCVPARYIKSICSCDNGNFLIEALPPPRTKERMKEYEKSVSGYFVSDIESMTQHEKMLSIRALRQFRTALPFHEELELYFNLMLVESYRNRKRRPIPSRDVKIIKNNQEESVGLLVQGNVAASANAGCALIGYSGCGKSSALEILLSNYPQVIEHTTERATRLTQIVYITVVCPTNSNFSALYAEIGAAIDRALGNTEQIYEKMVIHRKSLPEKANCICNLIEKFAIGCIILDEIQMINFKAHRENSFESLLTIVNKTKVAMLTVGTEDALEKMYPNLRTGRRAGTVINASNYCASQEFFNYIVRCLLKYQWIDHKIEPTQEILDTFYEVTAGIIDQLIGVYIFVQMDYLLAKTKYIIERKHILKTVSTRYPGLRELLKTIGDPSSEKKRRDIIKQADLEMDMLLQDQKQALSAQQIMRSQTERDEQGYWILRDKIIFNLQNTLQMTEEVYEFDEIEHVVDSVLSEPGNRNKTENDLSRKAYQILRKKKTTKHISSKSKQKTEIPVQLLMDSLTNIQPPNKNNP